MEQRISGIVSNAFYMMLVHGLACRYRSCAVTTGGKGLTSRRGRTQHPRVRFKNTVWEAGSTAETA